MDRSMGEVEVRWIDGLKSGVFGGEIEIDLNRINGKWIG